MSTFASQFAAGVDQAMGQLASPVTYTPAATPDASISLSATKGDTELVVSGQVMKLSSEHRDFLVRTKDLVVGGNPYVPQRGDTITEADTGHVYQVLMSSGTSYCWTWADKFNVRRRIHTKRVS